jgi:hypothetical protein
MAQPRLAPSAPERPRHIGRVRNIAVAAVATAAAVAATALYFGGSAPAKRPAITALRKQQGLAAGRALTVGRGPDRPVHLPVVSIGLMPNATDAAALAGLQQGYFSQQLGGQVKLDPIAYDSGPAESAALASGRLDAAYIQPGAAVTAWQQSGHKIRIVSGATSDRHGTAATAVLVISAKFLAIHAAEAEELLQAQVRSNQFVATNEVLAVAAARIELAFILGHKVAAKQLATSVAVLAFTNDPLAASIRAQAAHADGNAPNGELSGLFDLGPLNKLLRTSGEVPVPT